MADERTAGEIGAALRQLLQAGREMQAHLARSLGVRVVDVAAVDHLVSAAEPVGTVELGRRLGIRSASAAVLVDRLVDAGHLTRSPHPTDRRRVTLEVTEHARTEVVTGLAPLLGEVAAITTRLDDDTADAVLGFLREVIAAMQSYAG